MGRRIQWLGVGLMLCFAVIIAQLVNIQVREAPKLRATAHSMYHTQTFDNFRGKIYAADNEILAQSVKMPKSSGSSYEYMRQYPMKTLFSQIVGYDSIIYGTTGIESEYNTQLILHRPPAKTIHDLLYPPSPTTDTVTLTVLPYLQADAKQALGDIESPNKDGAIVVLDPHTGAVLAMYSSPSYVPTTLASPTTKVQEQGRYYAFGAKDAEGFIGGYPLATWTTEAPGSTFKVVTTSAVYNLDPKLSNFVFPKAGCLSLKPYGSNKTLCNDADTSTYANPCGGPITTMLPQSCDPGYAALGIAVGPQNLYDQANLFGYDQKPPIDLPLVQASRFPTVKTFGSPQDYGPLAYAGLAYSAFGQQTVAATALQQAMVAAAVANGGVLMAPHLMAKITATDGTPVEKFQPYAWKTSMTPAAATQVKVLMEAVATRGTAAGIFTPSWDVAVKTGTAQTTLPDNEANTQDWMIGFAPANDPQVAVCVEVPYQPVTTSGARVAGPIMREMLTAAMHPPPGQ